MVKVLRPDYIKFLKKENRWPSEFLETDSKETNDSDGDIFVNNNRSIISEPSDSSNDSE